MPELTEREKSLLLSAIGNPESARGIIEAIEISPGPSDYIHTDGSVPFTGNQSLGNNKLTDVGLPSDDSDASNKVYTDTKAPKAFPIFGGSLTMSSATGAHILWTTPNVNNLGVASSTSAPDYRPKNCFIGNQLVVGNLLGIDPPYGLNHSLTPGTIYAGSIANAGVILGANPFFNSTNQGFMLFGKDSLASNNPGFVNPATSDTNYEVYFSLVKRSSARVDYLKFGTGDLTFMQSSGANLLWNTDGGGDIGADGATRPNNIFSKNNLTVGNNLYIPTSHTPSAANDTGTTGQIAWDSSYLYVCVNTNTWKRVAISTWP